MTNGARMRGISIGVGSDAPQTFSVFASADNNETYLYGKSGGHCPEGFSDSACRTFRGGFYDPESSHSNGTTESRKSSDGVDALWLTDTFQLQTNFLLKDFGFGIPYADLNAEWISQAQLGLGRNSTLLNVLKNAGRITSRAYSLFWGLVGGPENQQMPGSLVLGGLDQAFIGNGKAENLTSSLNYKSNCSTGMLVSINDISLNWPNGTDTSIFMGSQSSAIQACIAPSFAGLMTIPFLYWRNFRTLAGGEYPEGTETRSVGINYFTMLFQPEGVYYGDLTFSFQNSISIRIPNTELVVPDRSIAPSDGQIVTNDTVRNLVLNPIQAGNVNDLPVIGRLFFSSAYLSVNHDTETFSLWQADTKAELGNIAGLDEKNQINDVFCAAESHGTSEVPGPRATSTPTPTSTPRSSAAPLSGGRIAGIVVGIVIGLLIVATLIFLVLRRNRRGVQVREDGKEDTPPVPPYHSRPNLLTVPSELPENQPQEKKWSELQGECDAAELDGTSSSR
ncbi:aspartic peptidase domain-containing protein [Massariosphaeria phaeospora]|uniref:Aspartic peptidase domain-containing protein n=1 Tax=Massariosphaeria phaeospora TaxID=100035 RepID=A0A7C8I1F2_9PLEO|nr:aspartic peptidase domain-containing protein [Massariosphaeria phaeospora]